MLAIIPVSSMSVSRRRARIFALQAIIEAARAAGIETVPVLLGPLSYLLLGKSHEHVDAFDRLSLLPSLLPVYLEVLAALLPGMTGGHDRGEFVVQLHVAVDLEALGAQIGDEDLVHALRDHLPVVLDVLRDVAGLHR